MLKIDQKDWDRAIKKFQEIEIAVQKKMNAGSDKSVINKVCNRYGIPYRKK